MNYCKGGYSWISRESNYKDVISRHFQNTCQFYNSHTRPKIFWIVHRKLLLRNTHGTFGIYDNTKQINSERHYRTLQLKLYSRSRWMNINGNYMRNVCNTSSGHSCKLLNHTMHKQPWILSSQKITRIVATCVETYLINIGSEKFWNWLCWTGTGRSFDECIQQLSWKNHNILERKVILQYNHEMGL